MALVSALHPMECDTTVTSLQQQQQQSQDVSHPIFPVFEEIIIDPFGNPFCFVCRTAVASLNTHQKQQLESPQEKHKLAMIMSMAFDVHVKSDAHISNNARFINDEHRNATRKRCIQNANHDRATLSILQLKYGRSLTSPMDNNHDSIISLPSPSRFTVYNQHHHKCNCNNNNVPSTSAEDMANADHDLMPLVHKVRLCFVCNTTVAGDMKQFIQHCRGKKHTVKRKQYSNPFLLELARQKSIATTPMRNHHHQHRRGGGGVVFARRPSRRTRGRVWGSGHMSGTYGYSRRGVDVLGHNFAMAMAGLSLDVSPSSPSSSNDFTSNDDTGDEGDDENENENENHLFRIHGGFSTGNELRRNRRGGGTLFRTEDVAALEQQLNKGLCLDTMFERSPQRVNRGEDGKERKNETHFENNNNENEAGIANSDLDLDLEKIRVRWNNLSLDNDDDDDKDNHGHSNDTNHPFKEEIVEIE